MSTEAQLAERVDAAYREHRQRLLSVAYRMLGSFTDAEDVVQDAFLRLRSALDSGTDPLSDRAWLLTVTTRLSIDHLKSARVRRESYVGPWLPEPAVEGLTDLADVAALADSVSTAFLLLLERLAPEQRAALLLRDVFVLPVSEIARIVGRSEAATRQLTTRARRAIRAAQPRFHVSRRDAEVLTERFFAAARRGDLEGLVEHLTRDAEFVGDGGDSGRGVTRSVTGARAVAAIVRGIFRQLERAGGALRPVSVGTEPGVLILDREGKLAGVWSLVLVADKVAAVHGMVNPDKLDHLRIPLTRFSRHDHWGAEPHRTD